jgi:hypothetical protein
VKFLLEYVTQRRLLAMLRDEPPWPRKAEHLTMRVVRLNRPIAVEESDLIRLEYRLHLLVAHPQHKVQGHPPGSEFFGIATMPQVGQVVVRVGVSQATALRVEDAIEASLGLPLRRRLPPLLCRCPSHL